MARRRRPAPRPRVQVERTADPDRLKGLLAFGLELLARRERRTGKGPTQR
jgi:hypothetical protein